MHDFAITSFQFKKSMSNFQLLLQNLTLPIGITKCCLVFGRVVASFKVAAYMQTTFPKRLKSRTHDED